MQQLGRRGAHPRPARPVGKHTLEDPAWIAEPPGHPARGRIDLQQDAATLQPPRVRTGHPHRTIITTPTPLQRQAFELLGISHRLGYP